MKEKIEEYSFVFFPYLKTSETISIGNLKFRSSEDNNGLNPEQLEHLSTIKDMLYLKDSLRIKLSSYAIVPFSVRNLSNGIKQHFKNIQAVVAYLYTSPRHEFGDIFFPPEHDSMFIFTPGCVHLDLVKPNYNVETVQETKISAPNNRGEVLGYSGLYNFKQYFWVIKGSRLYSPVPNITLNISQDLSSDIIRAENSRCDYRLLFKLLKKPETRIKNRFFTALDWFNASNNQTSLPETAIVNLSIAFEALMRLPTDQKSDRLIDAISLLLGRVNRLDIWARQFYDARSQIVHEGELKQPYFIATNSKKSLKGQQYQTLLSYGRWIFQLCLGTLLTGAALAEEYVIEEKFITNEERFKEICTILSNKEIEPSVKLENIFQILKIIEQFRYVPESDLKLKTMISSVQLAAKVIMDCKEELPNEIKKNSLSLITTKTKDFIEELNIIKRLLKNFKEKYQNNGSICIRSYNKLIKTVWSYNFMYFYQVSKK